MQLYMVDFINQYMACSAICQNPGESVNPATSRHVFVVLMAMTVALGPLALDTYLPAFPAMADFLQVDSHSISLTLSVYIFVLSLGQLVGGPLSDRLGRAPVMLGGLLLFALASFAIWQVGDLPSLIALRAVQAFGGGCAMVCVPALVRDVVHGLAAAKLFSMIGLVMFIAPAIAPSIGSLLLMVSGWDSIFLFLGVYALLLVALSKLSIFRGTLTRPPASELSVLRRYALVLSTRPAMRFIALQAMSFSVMMLFITHSSFIYQEYFAVGPETFALLFAANVLMVVVMNLCNRLLLNYIRPQQILRMAVSIQAVGLVALLLIMWLTPSLWLFVPALMLAIGAMGATTPNNQACCMEYFSENSGTAAALMGAMQFSVAGVLSAVSALLPQQVMAIILAMAGCSAVCLVLVWAPFGHDKTSAAC